MPSLEVFGNRIDVVSGHGQDGLMVGLYDLNGLFNLHVSVSL